ncbi:hypothetical protein EOM09_04320, partial [bacterium]|nr:hypothetical protein [bacterium]
YNYINGILKSYYLNSEIAYSFKTNNLLAICKIFKNVGVSAEVVSKSEYKLAKSAGFEGNKIIFNGPFKNNKDLLIAIKNNSIIQIDNFNELERLIKISNNFNFKINVGIRLNSRNFGKSRFGFNIENGEAQFACNKIINSNNLNLLGLHMHIGYNIGSNLPPFIYKKESKILCNFALKLKKINGCKIKYLNFGGGFPSVNIYNDSFTKKSFEIENYFKIITEVVKDKFPKKDMKIFFELGRSLIDEGSILISKIISDMIFKIISIEKKINFRYHQHQPGI